MDTAHIDVRSGVQFPERLLASVRPRRPRSRRYQMVMVDLLYFRSDNIVEFLDYLPRGIPRFIKDLPHAYGGRIFEHLYNPLYMRKIGFLVSVNIPAGALSAPVPVVGPVMMPA